jgi:phosphoenolpyruvate-protein kinase (PTS system EI component)
LLSGETIGPVPGMTVLANINVAGDVAEAVARQAEGIGLYRTEMEIIAAGEMPAEDWLYERYLAVYSAMQGKPVVFRVLDMGSDKPLPSLSIPREDNPALGWRGARLLLGRPDLLKSQARALARLSQHGPVDVLYPMVIDLAQFLAIRRLFREAAGDVEWGVIRHGVMFEVPSACLDAAEILSHADFGSVGTNDLIQYMYAVDRNNERVAYDFRSDRESLWRLLGQLAQAAESAGRPLSVCGELASDPVYVARLMDVGIRSVSVGPGRIATVRSAVSRRSAT